MKLTRVLLTGTLVNLLSAATAAVCGQLEGRGRATPINAISHIVWRDDAFHRRLTTWKYTATGLGLNELACAFWAGVYEALPRRAGFGGRLLASGGVAAFAYVTDYYLIPRRFTPGFEEVLSPRALLLIYLMIALGLAGGSRTVERMTEPAQAA